MKFTSLFIFFIILLSSSCSEVETERLTKRLVSDETILTSTSAFLKSQRVGQDLIDLGQILWSNGLDVRELPDLCGLAVDTSYVANVAEPDFSVESSGNIQFSLTCTENKIPTRIIIENKSSGNFTNDKYEGNFQQNSSIEARLNLLTLGLNFTGSTGQTGDINFLNQSREESRLNTSFRFDLTQMTYDILSGSILDGKATMIIRFSDGEVREEYTILINYIDASTIVIEFNDQVFEILI